MYGDRVFTKRLEERWTYVGADQAQRDGSCAAVHIAYIPPVERDHMPSYQTRIESRLQCRRGV
jgi:hypothetical protein